MFPHLPIILSLANVSPAYEISFSINYASNAKGANKLRKMIIMVYNRGVTRGTLTIELKI